MSQGKVPKKYAPKGVPPRASGSPLDVTQIKPLLEGYYYNIEQQPTMKHHTKKCYLYNVVSWARSIVSQHFRLTAEEKQSWGVDFAVSVAVRELEKRRQLFLELTSDANPTLLKTPRGGGGQGS